MPGSCILTYLHTSSDNFLSSCAAALISFCAKIALITATPSIPVPFNCKMLSRLIPPIATTGICLYNLNGYYNSLKELLEHMIEKGLSTKERQEGIYFAENLELSYSAV